jgi:hypothetical protein
MFAFKKIWIPFCLLVLGVLQWTQAQNLVGETEVFWKELPNQSLDFGDEIELNSPLFDDLFANAPANRIVLNDRGLSFHTDGSEDVSSYPTWLQKRAELRESPLGQVTYGHTQIYEFEFEVDDLPQLSGPVTIFQRFNKGKNGPDLDIELKGDSQWPSDRSLDNGSVLIRAFGQDWVKTGHLLGSFNHLVVAIYSHADGYFKVSLNGHTLAEGPADTTPDDTYSGPQFGIYNHGGTEAFIGLTHTRYYHAEYDGRMDFDEIVTKVFDDFGPPETANTFSLIIYPNPTSQILTIDTDAKGKAILYDEMGRVVLRSHSNVINMDSLENGVYLLEWKSQVGTIKRKVIKQ